MKLNDAWKYKNLEILEKKIWQPLDSNEDSYLINTCYSLRKKIIIDFTTEDLRIMIGQDIGLNYLIPLAIENLAVNILSEGDLYEGDLLTSILKSDAKYWKIEKKNWETICSIFENNKNLLEIFDTTYEIRNTLFKLFEEFKKINL